MYVYQHLMWQTNKKLTLNIHKWIKYKDTPNLVSSDRSGMKMISLPTVLLPFQCLTRGTPSRARNHLESHPSSERKLKKTDWTGIVSITEVKSSTTKMSRIIQIWICSGLWDRRWATSSSFLILLSVMLLFSCDLLSVTGNGKGLWNSWIHMLVERNPNYFKSSAAPSMRCRSSPRSGLRLPGKLSINTCYGTSSCFSVDALLLFHPVSHPMQLEMRVAGLTGQLVLLYIGRIWFPLTTVSAAQCRLYFSDERWNISKINNLKSIILHIFKGKLKIAVYIFCSTRVANKRAECSR